MRSSDRPMMWREPPVGAEGSAGPRFHLPAGTVTFLMATSRARRGCGRSPGDDGGAVGDVYSDSRSCGPGTIGVRPVEQGEGDSVVGAFSRASDAVAAAVEAQRELASGQWPEGMQLRVRIALHTATRSCATGQLLRRRAVAVRAAARDRARRPDAALAWRRATWSSTGCPRASSWSDCGVHRLRDLGRPEHVFALAHRRASRWSSARCGRWTRSRTTCRIS